MLRPGTDITWILDKTKKNINSHPTQPNIMGLLENLRQRKGDANVLSSGPTFDEVVAFYRKRGVRSPIRHIVLIKVERAVPLVSPAYDSGASEAEVRTQWARYWSAIHEGEVPEPTGE